ncbi:hypothetical protein OG792_07145 [Micromonospora sp. NBC_01699]|uniref:hypothetical protein n=1 Tax=Micromonospora sp. NBC_01699 TaxID=2975984 RepID=UPI002E350171|nr:hypothetical protein [Micromonospora sp. NBC_01699]
MLRRLFVAVVLAIGITALIPSSPAQALYPCPAGKMCLHTWYADSAHTTWRGSYSINCDAVVLRLGTQSGYLVFTTSPCGGVEPPPIS